LAYGSGGKWHGCSHSGKLCSINQNVPHTCLTSMPVPPLGRGATRGAHCAWKGWERLSQQDNF
jgi:hypothetical protein